MVLTGKPSESDDCASHIDILPGPMLATGDELATAASQAAGQDLKFENVSECVFPSPRHSRSAFSSY
jgi:hypothetical protein